jgi:hypothetical protein
LGLDSDGADLGESESEGGPVGGVLGVLVEAGGESDGIGEGPAQERLFDAAVGDAVVTGEAWPDEGEMGGDS